MAALGLGLGARLALQLATLAIVLTATVSWIALFLVEATFERQLVAELDRAVAQVERVLDTRGRALEAALAGLEQHLKAGDPALLERLLGREARLRDAAEPLMRRAGLDLLEMLDEAGRVISSGHYPERVDLEASSWLLLPGDEVSFEPVAISPREQRLVQLLRRPLVVGSRRIEMIGGLVLDERVIEALGAADAAFLLAGSDGEGLEAGRGGGIHPARLRRQVQEATDPAEPFRIADPPAAGWIARSYAIPSVDGAERGSIVVALDRARLDILLGRMRHAFLLVGAAAVLIAAAGGMWIARGVTRPVDELVRAVDAIGRNEADYTFPSTARNEFEELVASFSRLQRSLELQRLRSAAAERVAAWREVARHVAHEVKNPLAPIRLTVQNLMRAKQAVPQRFDEMFGEGMATILEEVEQLTRLVGEFSEFARLPPPEREPVDLDRVLDEVLELYAAEPGLALRRDRATNLPPVALDRDQISRALKNIVGNAIEAMREAGPGQARLEVRTALEPEMVRVEIRDSGPGLSAAAARRIFEPYFTTKSGGTGLGMAITYRIITEHGGVVAVESREGRGASVVVRLPLRSDSPQAAAGVPASRDEVVG